MKRIFVLFLVGLFVCVSGFCQAAEIITSSPDGKIDLIVTGQSKGLFFSIKLDGKAVIADSPISITIDGKAYPADCNTMQAKKTVIDKRIVPAVSTITSDIREFCNESLIDFPGPVSFRVRVYNDGAAYRWESDIDKAEVIINAENFTLNFAADVNAYYPSPPGRGFFSHQENSFRYMKLSRIRARQKVAAVPALFELSNNKYLLLTDVNVEKYPALWLKGTASKTIESAFPPYPIQTSLRGDRNLTVSQYSDFLAKSKGKRAYPWRAFVITDSKGLLTSTLLYTLADACRLDDTSWIKPGKVAWDWWNAWNITDVNFDAGINQATYKNYIDFASENKLQYVILDEGWSVKGPNNLLDVVPELDIAELVEYASDKNVGVILWMTSVAIERSFDKAFDQFTEWGIKGLKIDFMQRDDQVMMDFCVKVAAEAAKHHLLVDYHGGSKPTGLQRTYPNVLTHESVLGLEQSKWGTMANPETSVLLPFTRMAAGPMDYTPGGMDNFTRDKFPRRSYNNPGTLGTRCHQLAMYVTFISPLQMLADTPTKYRKNPEVMPFLSAVPTTWDETKVLHAEVGDAIVIARRNGKKWFLGALTDWDARDITVKLDFLGSGKYNMRYWADGPDAANEPTDTAIGKKDVSTNSQLTIKLAPGGGYAAILEPIEIFSTSAKHTHHQNNRQEGYCPSHFIDLLICNILNY